MSVAMPVSCPRMWAAFAVGATPNTGRPVPVEVVDGAGQHRRLARSRRTDHHDEPVAARHRRGGVGLQHVQPGGPNAG